MSDSDIDANPVKVEVQGNIGVVTLNRPDKKNALDLTMRAAIADAVLRLDQYHQKKLHI